VLISVVIPTYNRAALVGRAIGSALAQTHPDLEVIVVDDASTDATAEVVREIRDPRLRFLSLPRNTGVSRARNVGIHASRGEWVAFLDSDDEWLPRKLELQIDRWRGIDDPRVTVIYGAFHYRQDLTGHTMVRPRDLPEGDVLDRAIGERLDIATPTVLAQRTALLAVGGFPEALRRYEDTELWVRLAAGNHFAAVSEPVAIVHRHAGPHLCADPAPPADASEILASVWRWVARRPAVRAGGPETPGSRIQRAYFEYKRLREAIERGDRATVGGGASGWRCSRPRCPAS
jgi:hypothetical protein